MTVHQVIIPVSGSTPAVLVLPQPATLEGLGRLEERLADSLHRLRSELGGCAADAGRIEYESWMQHLRPAKAA